jgi:hypothetical protein
VEYGENIGKKRQSVPAAKRGGQRSGDLPPGTDDLSLFSENNHWQNHETTLRRPSLTDARAML